MATEASQEEFLSSIYKGGELLSAGKVVDARAHLERAHQLEPKNEKAQNLLGLAYFKLGLFERASDLYEALVQENPADPTLRVNLGLVYLKTNNLPRCIKEFETATDLDPEHKKAHNYLGLALAQAGEYARAREHFLLAGSDAMADKMEKALVAAAPQKPAPVAPPPPPAPIPEPPTPPAAEAQPATAAGPTDEIDVMTEEVPPDAEQVTVEPPSKPSAPLASDWGEQVTESPPAPVPSPAVPKAITVRLGEEPIAEAPPPVVSVEEAPIIDAAVDSMPVIDATVEVESSTDVSIEVEAVPPPPDPVSAAAVEEPPAQWQAPAATAEDDWSATQPPMPQDDASWVNDASAEQTEQPAQPASGVWEAPPQGETEATWEHPSPAPAQPDAWAESGGELPPAPEPSNWEQPSEETWAEAPSQPVAEPPAADAGGWDASAEQPFDAPLASDVSATPAANDDWQGRSSETLPGWVEQPTAVPESGPTIMADLPLSTSPSSITRAEAAWQSEPEGDWGESAVEEAAPDSSQWQAQPLADVRLDPAPSEAPVAAEIPPADAGGEVAPALDEAPPESEFQAQPQPEALDAPPPAVTAPMGMPPPRASSPEAAGYSVMQGQRLTELQGDSESFMPEATQGPFHEGPNGLAINVHGEILTRLSGLVAIVGGIDAKPEPKKKRGRASDVPFGTGGNQLQRVTGHGVLHLEGGRGFQAIDLSDDDGTYIREERVFAFEEPLAFENGQLTSAGVTLDLVNLKGQGRVLLQLDGALKVMPVPAGAPMVVPLARVVGWFGHVSPRLMSFAGQVMVELTGEGHVMLGAPGDR